MMKSKFLATLAVFLLLISGSLWATTGSDATSEERPPTTVYQKPSSMLGVEWVQYLEDERDKADRDGNCKAFQKITDEISASIAGKHGFFGVTATEKLTLVHAIIRTRHRFRGQCDMLYDRYLGYDRPRTSAMLYPTLSLRAHIASVRFRAHMAFVLAINTMVRRALEDDDFSDSWSKGNDTKEVPPTFISAVVTHARSKEKREIFDLLYPSLLAFLRDKQSTIHLANDIFRVFAPRMSLAEVYAVVAVSGEAYKGWTVHNIGAFTYPVTLTEEEKFTHPGLEDRLRDQINRRLLGSPEQDIFSSSERAALPTDEIRTRFGLRPDVMVVEYFHDECLVEKSHGVRGTGPKSFYLSRPVPPHLIELLRRPHGVIPAAVMPEIFTCSMVSTTEGAPAAVVKAAADRGFHPALYKQAVKLLKGEDDVRKDTRQALERCQEAANLGHGTARKNLSAFLNNYALMLFDGLDGVRKDIHEAIKVCREAASLGNEVAKKNLSAFLNNYALMLFDGLDGVRKDIHEAIKVCREAASLGNEAAKKNLAILLNNYAVMLFNEQGGIGMNSLKAMELWRESASLGDEDAKRNLSIIAAHRALPPLMMFYPCYPF